MDAQTNTKSKINERKEFTIYTYILQTLTASKVRQTTPPSEKFRFW